MRVAAPRAAALPIFLAAATPAGAAETAGIPGEIYVGRDPISERRWGWADGLCYHDVEGAIPGDELEFVSSGHNVVKFASAQHWEKCDFSSGTLLADVGDTPYKYVITEEDQAQGAIFFGCSIQGHCMALQKIAVSVMAPGKAMARIEVPQSFVSVGLQLSQCNVQRGDVATGALTSGVRASTCAERQPTADGGWSVSCLSSSVTLTAGGVINSARVMHYPFPSDERVRIGMRTWNFVAAERGTGGEGREPVYREVPLREMYIHHLAGNVVLGQGGEGIDNVYADAPFHPPYAKVSGDELDWMIFHLIDLRGVDQWLECVECRCLHENGTYLDYGGGEGGLGGVDCCHNCTSSIPQRGSEVDYFMRYNVTYYDIKDGDRVAMTQMLTAETAAMAGRSLEWDVPRWDRLPASHRVPGRPKVQHLAFEKRFEEMFHHQFFEETYHGPDMVTILRCVGHLHIAGLLLRLENADTGETICECLPKYGTVAGVDEGMLVEVTTAEIWPPKVLRRDQRVRLVSEYDATHLHTGVMAMLFIDYASEHVVTPAETVLRMDVCVVDRCEAELLPQLPEPAECVDTLADNAACRFGGLCDCAKEAPNAEPPGCGGAWCSAFGCVEVSSVCPAHCGACPDADAAARETAHRAVEHSLARRCAWPTPACRGALGNLLACGAGRATTAPVDPLLASFVREMAPEMVQQHRRFGHASRHYAAGPPNFASCPPPTPAPSAGEVRWVEEPGTSGPDGSSGGGGGGAAALFAGAAAAAAAVVAAAGLCWWRRRRRRGAPEAKPLHSRVELPSAHSRAELRTSGGAEMTDARLIFVGAGPPLPSPNGSRRGRRASISAVGAEPSVEQRLPRRSNIVSGTGSDATLSVSACHTPRATSPRAAASSPAFPSAAPQPPPHPEPAAVPSPAAAGGDGEASS